MSPAREITECLVCKATLGQESRDMGYILCHEHRKCVSCGLDISVAECKACLLASQESEEELEVIHARCRMARQRVEPLSNGTSPDATITIKQSEFDFLNLCRLAIIPNPDLNIRSNEIVAEGYGRQLIEKMDFEQLQKHIRMLESCAAQNRNILNANPKQRKELAAIREAERKESAKQEAATSSRPAGKKSNDLEEVQLAHFMEIHEVKERTVGLKLMHQLNKAVRDLVKAGFAEPTARETALNMMKQNRQIVK